VSGQEGPREACWPCAKADATHLRVTVNTDAWAGVPLSELLTTARDTGVPVCQDCATTVAPPEVGRLNVTLSQEAA
jgi:hypothetical protein